MNSSKKTTEVNLQHQLEGINACYDKSLDLLREAQLTDDEINAAEQMRPIMQRILELEEQSGIKEENVIAVVRRSKPLTALVKSQEQLLRQLLLEIQKVETKLTSKRTQVSKVRDHQQRRQEMQTAYRQYK